MSRQRARRHALVGSIGVRLPAGILLSVSLLVVLIVYTATMSQRSLKESIAQGMVFLTTELMARVNHELSLRTETIQMQARDPQVLALLARSNGEFDAARDVSRRIAQGERAWDGRPGAVSTPFMRELAGNPLATIWRDKFIDFHHIKYGYAVVEDLYLTNRHGAVVAMTGTAPVYGNAGLAWWQSARRDGLFFNESQGGGSEAVYGVGICLRIDDASGRFAGVLYARVNMNAIVRSAAVAVPRFETTVITLLTGEGRTVYSTRPFHFLEPLGDGTAFGLMAGPEGSFTARRGTRRELFTYARGDFSGSVVWPRWILVLEHDLGEILAPSARLNARIAIASALLMAMSVLIAVLLSRSLIVPLHQLARSVREAGEGDLHPMMPLARADEIGELAQAFTAMIDRRRAAESLLAAQKDFTESIIDTANVLIVTIAADGTIRSFNRFAERRTGFARNEVIGRNWFEIFVDPSDRGELRSAQTELMSSPTAALNHVNTIIARSGERILVDWTNSVLADSHDGAPATLSIGIDLTDRTRTEHALYEAEAKYRSAMDSMADMVYICSPQLRIEYMNRAMIGWIGRDATGESCHLVLHARAERCEDCTWEQLGSGSPVESDFVDPKDGRSFHLTHTPVVHQDGSVSRMTVYRETTTIRKIEARLRQAQKMESLGTLAGGIAHDFNNILSPIIGYSEMLLAGSLGGNDARDAHSSILQAARRARDLVQQILTFSRQRRYELRPIHIQAVIGEALKLARASLPSTITIRQQIDPHCRMVMADATEVHQIAMNLVTNAFHAMKKAGGVLTVALTQVELGAAEAALREAAPGTYVCLTVADTGVGMDRHTMENLFDPYFTTKAEGEEPASDSRSCMASSRATAATSMSAAIRGTARSSRSSSRRSRDTMGRNRPPHPRR